ncbi:MAG: permease [Candidatus Woesearchaeota archaeon]
MIKFIKKVKEFFNNNWVLFLLFFSYLIVFLGQKQIGSFLAQEDIQKIIGQGIYNGWLSLVDYLSAHVLMCLIPAFFIAGAINSLIGTNTILKYLSGKTKKHLAYIIAGVGGFFLEVCSCTILPLFAGIWKKGAGLGIAVTLLYAGPSNNVVTLMMTGQRIGWQFAFFRLLFSISFAILIGLIMDFLFRNEKHEKTDLIISESKLSLKGIKSKIFWVLLFSILIIGTAPIPNNIKTYSVLGLTLFEIILAFKWLTREERNAWWQETIKFTSDIIPLLLFGVFLAGMFTHFIPKEEFQKIAGQNTITSNLIAVAFGAIAYFPALVEVPIAENFMKLGMNKGPLMAYMLADPVLSLQGLLIISKMIGKKKTFIYLMLIVILTTSAGYLYGLFG